MAQSYCVSSLDSTARILQHAWMWAAMPNEPAAQQSSFLSGTGQLLWCQATKVARTSTSLAHGNTRDAQVG